MFHEQTKRFKINFSHSFLLRHKESGNLSFFHASANNHTALERPRLIQSKQDFLCFLNEINDHDILEQIQKERPNSRFSVQNVMSTTFYVNPLPDFPIGCACDDLPDYISTNPFLHKLQKDEHHGFLYNDGLCFFRCLALHQGDSLHNLQTPTKSYFEQWAGYSAPSHFPGVTLLELESIEDTFQINIDVFEFDETRSLVCIVPLRRSAYKYTEILRLLRYNNHFMYIIDIDKLGCALACSKCGKLWKSSKQLNKHENACQGTQPIHTYTGGVYSPPLSILQQLHTHGIHVDTTFVFPYRATFDFEVFFTTDDLPHTKSKDTSYTAKHIPLSVSVASNLPGFVEPRCFVTNGDSQELVDRMINYLEEISSTSYTLLRERFKDVFKQLDCVEDEQQNNVDSLNIPIQSLKEKLEEYLQELPVVGFNSSRYDLNVIKPFLIQHFVVQQTSNEKYYAKGYDIEEEAEEEEEEQQEEQEKGQRENKGKKILTKPFKFIVKRNNEYMCIATEKLKFLDIMNFLAPGFSYAKYLAAFEVTEKKAFFPYEYITSLDKLKDTHLPPHDAFYSTLKNTNISADDYAYCQRIWKELTMSTLKDFLVFYNNKDVTPFLIALERQITIYADLGIDLLKDGISVPGITLKYLFQTSETNTYFSLFNEQQKELHTLLKNNLTGGPSIIFHRYHEKDVTCLRNNPQKPVKSIQGYDANALYLSAIMKDMPTEHPIVRKKENNFKAEKTDPYGRQAREWLEYTAHTKQIQLQHKFNSKEKQLGRKKIRVDGWDVANRTVYQFHGCLFHGHDCYLTTGKTVNPINGKTLAELGQNTRDITNYLHQKVGVAVIEKYECEWKKERDQNPSIQQFLQTRFPQNTPFKNTSTITDQTILEAVRNETLFGLIQCDIRVPDHLKKHFSELQPIFKNCEVGKDDIGSFMKEYAERHRLLSQPRRTLVASYFGNNILLATPLLKWYLEHGLVVDNITLIIEYQPKPCFKSFGEKVSNARREGDKDPSKAILADTFKLLGNSAYGKTLTNVAKHRDIHYVSCDKATTLINECRFQKLTELSEDVVEVEMSKKKIKWSLPLQIGFFVYQYAKLRMLEFHYDFVDRFVSREDYQLCEMDTDSLYMALSGSSFEDVVRPELREAFYREWDRWFPALACETHKSDFQDARIQHQKWNSAHCSDCLARRQFDKRTPGLFKTEYSGEGFIGLCSKTYFCFGEHGDKFSSKGLNKRQNTLTKDTYKQVLTTQESGGGTNHGFRTDGKTMFTYAQNRKSLSFMYIKRVVKEDGLSTDPIDV